MGVATHQSAQSRRALPVRVSHRFTAGSARFDEDNLVSDAGLVPLLGLAEQTGLAEIIARKVSITAPRIKSGSANPAPKLLTVIAGMCAGADSIDDLDMLRAGGMPILFDGVYAPSTVGTLLREFSFGHARQLGGVRSSVYKIDDQLIGVRSDRDRGAAVGAPAGRAGRVGAAVGARGDQRHGRGGPARRADGPGRPGRAGPDRGGWVPAGAGQGGARARSGRRADRAPGV